MSMRKRINWAGALVLGFSATGVRAEEAAGALTEEATLSLAQIVKAGGSLMYVLGAMSVLAVAFIVYYAIVLRQETIAPRALLLDLRDALRDGRLEEARRACDRNRSPMASIAAAGLTVLENTNLTDSSLLKEILEGEGGRQAAQMQSQTQYLLDIAVIAPMLGLLGTVMGMLQAFNAVALDIARARPMVLADGVSKALVTTAAGLIIGIPAMAFYSFFRGRVSRLISTIESHSADLLLLLLNRKQP